MSRTYYYSRANSYSRKKKGFQYKLPLLLAIIVVLFVIFAGEVAPNIETIERSISAQIEQIRSVQPSE